MIHEIVSVFITDVESKEKAECIITTLKKEYPDFIITIDLEDCDNVLRIEGNEFNNEDIIDRLYEFGNHCEELNY